MDNISIIGATCACLVVGSFNVSAIAIEADWKNAGDDLITYDANTGLEWMGSTETNGLSRDLVTRILVQREGEGLRFATYFEFLTLWENSGGELHSTIHGPYQPTQDPYGRDMPPTGYTAGLTKASTSKEGAPHSSRFYTFLTALPTSMKTILFYVLFPSVLLISIGVLSMGGFKPRRRRRRKRHFKYYKRHT